MNINQNKQNDPKIGDQVEFINTHFFNLMNKKGRIIDIKSEKIWVEFDEEIPAYSQKHRTGKPFHCTWVRSAYFSEDFKIISSDVKCILNDYQHVALYREKCTESKHKCHCEWVNLLQNGCRCGAFKNGDR
jgi:hypothetical protein